MPSSWIGTAKESLDTPALLVDLDLFNRNVRNLVSFCHTNNTAWRPHSKAHKSPVLAQVLIDAGACGITCAKLSEAEVMVDQGIKDILIANQLATPIKWQRLAALQQSARVCVAVDDSNVVTQMSWHAREAGVTIPVLIDIDVGMHRTGIVPGEPARQLAGAVATATGLEFAGVMGYEGHVLDISPPMAKADACRKAMDLLAQTSQLIQADGLPVGIVSAGGTGCYRLTAAHPSVTELQAGGGIFMDAMYRDLFGVRDLEQALTVLATVTSRQAHHIVLDAGFKTLSNHHHPPKAVGRDDVILRYLSAEHGVWDITPGQSGPKVGEQIELLVGYSDSTNFMHEQFFGLREGRVETVWEITARGKIQ